MSISVRVNGSKYGSFTSANITRSLDRAVSDLSLTVAAWGASRFPPGSAVEVFVDEHKVLSGYFMRLKKSTNPKQTSTTLSILSKTTDLVDSSAEPGSFVGLDPVVLARTLARKHSVDVVGSGFVPVPRVRVQPGETVFQTVERAVRGQYGLITDDEEGRLVLTHATTKEDGGSRRLAVGKNVISVDYDIDWTKRFKTYKVFGQGKGVGNVDHAQVGIEQDENASRERLLILVGAASQPGVTARNRATWERNQRIGQSIGVNVTVRGWLDPLGAIWKPNVMVSYTDPDIGWVEVPLLLVSTRFGLDNSGAIITSLELHPRKGYEPPEQTAARGARLPRTPFLDRPPWQPPYLTKLQAQQAKGWKWPANDVLSRHQGATAPWLAPEQTEDVY